MSPVLVWWYLFQGKIFDLSIKLYILAWGWTFHSRNDSSCPVAHKRQLFDLSRYAMSIQVAQSALD